MRFQLLTSIGDNQYNIASHTINPPVIIPLHHGPVVGSAASTATQKNAHQQHHAVVTTVRQWINLSGVISAGKPNTMTILKMFAPRYFRQQCRFHLCEPPLLRLPFRQAGSDSNCRQTHRQLADGK